MKTLIDANSCDCIRERENHSAHLASIEAELDMQVAKVGQYTSVYKLQSNKNELEVIVAHNKVILELCRSCLAPGKA